MSKEIQLDLEGRSKSLDTERGFKLSWFEIRDSRKCPNPDNPRYAVWAVGQWQGHLMDWRGCNFWHKKISTGGTFSTIEEAKSWLAGHVESGLLSDGMLIPAGSFMGDNGPGGTSIVVYI